MLRRRLAFALIVVCGCPRSGASTDASDAPDARDGSLSCEEIWSAWQALVGGLPNYACVGYFGMGVDVCLGACTSDTWCMTYIGTTLPQCDLATGVCAP